jgi:1-aminocyclopropane-1-carboxylate deaminase/D-cysteine desulfhydrase-like pyridoxal-dependent ACC family enzyme
MTSFQRLTTTPPAPLQELAHRRRGLRLFVLRDDERYLPAYPGDRAFGGNKWRKLQHNLLAAREQGYRTLLTFGGAYSNHLAATASAGRLFGFRSVGVVRGEADSDNPTLRHARRCGMQLHFLDRSAYRQKETPEIRQALLDRFGPCYVLPEGGTNALALQGCRAYAGEITEQLGGAPPDYLVAACGTGGTLAGIITGLTGRTQAIGLSVLKGGFLQKEIAMLLDEPAAPDWTVLDDYHFGGYARFRPPLIDFINRFRTETGIPLDPIYTGKLFYGVFDLLEKDYFPPGSTVAVLHSGGLQGVAGFNERFGKVIG